MAGPVGELHAQLKANLPVLTGGCNRGEARLVAQPLSAWKGGGPGGSAAYFGLNYTPSSEAHPPPPPVASVLRLAPCTELCCTCRRSGCSECPACCLHFDPDEESFSLGCFWQQRKVRPVDRVWFVVGGRAFCLAGGLAVAFQGGLSLHGVWAPANADRNTMWLGQIFVMRRARVAESLA